MFKQIKFILPDFLVKHGFHEQAKTINVVQTFDEYLQENSSDAIRNNCNGLYVQNGCFYIGVSANAAAQEIQLHKDEILQFLHDKLEESTISDIRCKITKVEN